MMKTKDEVLVWEDDSASMLNRFVGSRRILADKTVATLKSSVFVAYPFPIVFMSFSEGYLQDSEQPSHFSRNPAGHR